MALKAIIDITTVLSVKITNQADSTVKITIYNGDRGLPETVGTDIVCSKDEARMIGTSISVFASRIL